MRFGICVTIQKRDDMEKAAMKSRRAGEERVSRGLEEVRELLRKNEVVFDRWQAEGTLPPEEPRRRI
jgi:hypothetical protein